MAIQYKTQTTAFFLISSLHSRSPEWQKIPKSKKQEIGLRDDEDGEFWMPFDDFFKFFNIIEICHYSPSQDLDRKWLVFKIDLLTCSKMCIANFFFFFKEGNHIRGRVVERHQCWRKPMPEESKYLSYEPAV